MFRCTNCGQNPFGEERCDECPHIYHNILNVNYNDASRFDFEYFKNKWPIYFKKYDRKDGEVKSGVIYQYKFVLNKLQMKEGVVLDFGCALAHASETVKEHSSDITYIGADVFKDVLFAGSELYKTADYLLNIDATKKMADDSSKNILTILPGPLRYIEDDSVDLIIASRIAGWSNYDIFFPEFLRTLKPGGHLFFWSNAGHFDGKKMEMFEYLSENFIPVKKNKRIKNRQAISAMMWGNKTAFMNKEITEKQSKFKFRGLFAKPEKSVNE